MTVRAVGAVAEARMPVTSRPLDCNSSRTKPAKKSLPTLPHTAAGTPSLARSMAALAAQPPAASSISSTSCSSPDTGRRGSGGTNRSATRMPTHITSKPEADMASARGCLHSRDHRGAAGAPVKLDQVADELFHSQLALQHHVGLITRADDSMDVARLGDSCQASLHTGQEHLLEAGAVIDLCHAACNGRLDGAGRQAGAAVQHQRQVDGLVDALKPVEVKRGLAVAQKMHVADGHGQGVDTGALREGRGLA